MQSLYITLGLVAFASSTAAQPVVQGSDGWSVPETVWVHPDGIGTGAEVVVTDGVPAVVWFERRVTADSTVVPVAVRLARRLDGAWTPPQSVGTSRPLDYPSVASDGTTLVAVWPGGPQTLEDDADRLEAASVFGGRGGSTETAVYRDPDGPRPHVMPSFQHVAVHGGTATVLYQEITDRGIFETLVQRGPGGTWAAPVPLAEGFYGSLTQTLDGVLLAAYLSLSGATGRQGVAVALSRDGGQTWATHGVTTRPAGQRQASPKAVLDARGGLHVVWRQSTDNSPQYDLITYAFSGDRGESWTEPEAVRLDAGWYVSNLDILADAGGHPHVFYLRQHGFISAEGEILHTARRADGRWTPQRTLFGADSVRWAPRTPSLTVSDGRIHAVWTADRGGETRIQYATAPDSWLGAQLPNESALTASFVSARPNPARDSVTISSTLDAPGDVMIDIHTASGRLVAQRPIGPKPAGVQSASVDVSGLAAGVYVVTVRTASERHAGQVTLVR